MAIKVYISGNSGNKEIVTHQQRIVMILNSLAIECETVDIAAPGMDEAKDYMREKGKKKDGQRFVLPPQIFNGEKYCGDYEDFDIANEDDTLEEFLGIPRKTPKSVPAGEATEGPEVGKLPGDSQPPAGGEGTEQPPAEPMEVEKSVESADETHQGSDDQLPAEAPPSEAEVEKAPSPPPPTEPSEPVEGCQNEEQPTEEPPVIEASENLSNDPDHEQVEETTLVPDEQQDVMNNTTTDHEQPDWTGQNGVQEDDQNGVPKDIPALGPSTLEECPLGPKGNRLKLDIDEKRAEGGYQDLKNCGKFWRAAVMMGTP